MFLLGLVFVATFEKKRNIYVWCGFVIQSILGDRHNLFNKIFLCLIEDINSLKSNFKKISTHDHFFLKNANLKIDNFAMLLTNLCAL